MKGEKQNRVASLFQWFLDIKRQKVVLVRDDKERSGGSFIWKQLYEIGTRHQSAYSLDAGLDWKKILKYL